MNKHATHIIEKYFTDNTEITLKSSDDDKSNIANNILSAEILKTLPDECRSVCLLYFHHGLSREAIAKQLNISLSTVHNRLHRGLYLLKTQFAKKPKNPV